MSFEPLKPRDGKSFTLKYPFKLDGETYIELTVRRPRQLDLAALADGKGGAAARTGRMLANLAGVSPQVIEYLDPEDAAEIGAWLEPILDPKGQLSKDAGS